MKKHVSVNHPFPTSTRSSQAGPAAQPSGVDKAIILAAGIGDRLRPFTDTTPKCLAPVGGVPLLVNALTHLAAVGIREAVIVVGHHKEVIYERIGQTFEEMTVSYIEAADYDTTNNISSLWLARDHLVEDVLLLEADVFFERALLSRLLSQGDGDDNLAAVSRHKSWMSGTVVSLDEEGRIHSLLNPDRIPNFSYDDVFKTVNIYLLRKHFLERYFVPHLEAFIRSGDVNQYYEVVLAAMSHQRMHHLIGVRCGDLKWYEIDDESDRQAAEYMFASPEQRYEFISKQHGSFWRYGFVDHAYLYNLYFPPDRVLTHWKRHLRELILNYTVAQDALARLVGTICHQSSERIVVGNGASELIRIIGGHLVRRLAIPVPSFNEYENVVPEERCHRFALQAPGFQLDVDGFAEHVIRTEANVAVVVTPNNPTSLLIPKAELVRLLDKLAGHDCMLVVDESFMDFASQGAEHTLQHELDRYSNLAILNSMSKVYGACGLRLGYLLTANQAFAERVRGQVPIWNINGLAESFLHSIPRYRREFAHSCERVRADRDQLYEVLSEIPGMTACKPDANFVFCRLPDAAPGGPETTRQLFVQHDILIKHCAGKTMPDAHRYLRIAARTRKENELLAGALRDILAQPGAVAG